MICSPLLLREGEVVVVAGSMAICSSVAEVSGERCRLGLQESRRCDCFHPGKLLLYRGIKTNIRHSQQVDGHC